MWTNQYHSGISQVNGVESGRQVAQVIQVSRKETGCGGGGGGGRGRTTSNLVLSSSVAAGLKLKAAYSYL